MTTLAHVGETKIDDGSPPLDRSHQVFEHGRPPVELDPLPLSGGTLLGVALEAFVEFGEASGERRAPLVEAGSPNANVGAVRKKTTRRARQYMNRPGGFNRPLPEEKTGIKQNKI